MTFEKLIDKKYEIESFEFNNNFYVILNYQDNIIKLNFGDRIVRLKFYEEELSDYDNQIKSYLFELGKDISNTTLIEIKDSPLLKSLEESTNDFYSESNLKHYLIVSMNYIMEIITYDDVIIFYSNKI